MFRIAAAVLVLGAGAALLRMAEPPDVVKIVLVGDIMLSRHVAARIRQAHNPLLPFAGLSALLDSSDCNFGNLEAPFAAAGSVGGTSLVFAAPATNVEGLREHNFRVVSLANNHALDQDEDGLAYTLDLLSANGIEAVGVGRDLDRAWQPQIVEVRRTRIGFLAVSYASINDGGKTRNGQVARIEDVARLRSELRLLRPRADLIVVSMHAGSEYRSQPDPAQVAFAHAAIEAGAGVVVGSHPHWVQPIERYKGGLIFYSLGNFVFDLPGIARQGLAVRLLLEGKRLAWAELYPIEIENDCCPRPASAAESRQILSRMQGTSTLVRLP